MPDLTAKRTLVKSPPELWEELSEVERLARHLGAFGEITITKLEPEHTVAWEGEHASGTVSIEPSGWGTKVTLRAELPEREQPETAEPSPPEAQPNEPESGQNEPVPEPSQPEPVQEPEPVAESSPEPAVDEPADPEPAADAESAAKTPRRGFLGWLFRPRRAEPVMEAPAEPRPRADAPVAAEAAPEPELVVEPPTQAEPLPQETESVVEQPAAREAVAVIEKSASEESANEPEPVAETAQLHGDDHVALDPERARVILDEALDTLGAAHHRPFSRA